MAAIAHVGIVGAGLAGLAAAVAAARAGMRVDVFETQAEPEAPAAHIDVVPNLLRDLVALGVAEACVRRGFPYQGFRVLDGEGACLFELPTPCLAGPPWPAALGLVYGELLGALREAALALGVRLHAGCAVRDAGADALVTAQGERHGFDLVVVASGEALPSLAGRPAVPVPVEAMPQQWCHALLPRPAALYCATWVIGRGALRAMLVPVDARRIGVAVLLSAGSPATPARLRETLLGQGALLRSLATHWHDATGVIVRPVRSGLLAGPWHAQGVLRVGHSAHRLPPHFGQAAAQAVEDARVLGELLRARPERGALLEAFGARRGERARRVHAVAEQAARWQMNPEATTDLRALDARLAALVATPA